MFNRQVLPREHTNPEALQSAGRVHKRSRHERCASSPIAITVNCEIPHDLWKTLPEGPPRGPPDPGKGTDS